MTRSAPLPEPGFDLYAPIEPQRARGHRLAWVGAVLALAIFAGLVLIAFRSLDRPDDTPDASDLRGTIHRSRYVPPAGPRERDLASLTVYGSDAP